VQIKFVGRQVYIVELEVDTLDQFAKMSQD